MTERAHASHEQEKLDVDDFPITPIYEPLAVAYTQANKPAATTPFVIARYDMPINYEGLLHYSLLAVTNSGQPGPNPGLFAQIVVCPAGDKGTPKGTSSALSAQEATSPVGSLSEQVGQNLPVVSGTGSPMVVARNFYLPSTRRAIAVVSWDPATAPNAVLLWGYLWGYRWPINSLSKAERLALLLKNSATAW